MMVGCTTYTAPGSGTTTPVYIVKNQWGTGPNGARAVRCNAPPTLRGRRCSELSTMLAISHERLRSAAGKPCARATETDILLPYVSHQTGSLSGWSAGLTYCCRCAGWGMYIDPSQPNLGFNGFALMARDDTLEYGACAIASDAGYTYLP